MYQYCQKVLNDVISEAVGMPEAVYNYNIVI